MGTRNRIVLALLFFATGIAPAPAPAASEAARSVATYIAVEAARNGQAAAALLDYAALVRRDPAALRVLVLSELDRPGQFVLLESWRDETGWAAHASGAVRHALEGALQPILLAPFDDRLGLPMQAESSLQEPRGAVHVVLHVDVTGPGIDTMPDNLREAARNAARIPGAIAYEVATQSNKRNHFTVHQVWASQAAYNAYVASPGAKEFRARFNVAKGAIYDDRLFSLISP